MQSLVMGAAIMGGLGVFFGTVLAIAQRFLYVADDPRVESILSLLPGSNCGACGEPGCRRFAEKLVQQTAAPSRCTVCNPDQIATIAATLGVDPGEPVKRIARVHCAGGKAQALQIASYQGMASCAAAAVVSAGGKGCSWGCLGLGDCQRACQFDAIAINANGLPQISATRCTACGDCVGACPRELIDIMPINHHLLVQCKSPLSGSAARDLCTVACDSCGRCAMDAAPGLIRIQDNLPVVDYGAGGPAQPDATYRCPTQAIQWLETEQFQLHRVSDQSYG